MNKVNDKWDEKREPRSVLKLSFFIYWLMFLLITNELENEARLAAVRTENKSESLREVRLAADV